MNYKQRFGRLFFGLVLYSVGIVFTLNAQLGYGPWEVFHAGIGLTVGLPIGRISVLAGMVIVAIDVLCGEKLGAGTLINMVFIGTGLDILLALGVIPVPVTLAMRIAYLLLGLFIIAWATYFYISAALGAGPRDCLMVVLSRKTGRSNGLCKAIVEWSAVAIGFLLGGMVGVGTVIAAFGGGFFVQWVFNRMHFDARLVEHEHLETTLRNLWQIAAAHLPNQGAEIQRQTVKK